VNLRHPIVTLLLASLALAPPLAPRADDTANDMVQLDFQNAELTVVIDTIANMTGKNFIYDDRVRGRVTIVSPTPMPVDQAYAVFESVLQVKGFTTVETPGGALKVIPLRDAKETSVETIRSTRPPPNRDLFVTRLIPLRYIDAESIVNTLKPLVSKDAAMAAYQPTNTVILTESASNIRRLIAILESIDIEIYKEELAVIRVEFADATTMADQISEIFGAEVSSIAATRSASSRRRSRTSTPEPIIHHPGQLGKVRILTDERTNSLIVLAAKTQLEEVRRLVRKLDVPVSGGGRIHVYYLQHADAEELAQTLSAMISGAPAPAGGGAPGGTQAQAIRAAVSGLAEGISVTADPATNALVIQASQEGFNTLAAVIEKLDMARPQVLVEALIMEVDVTDSEELGFNAMIRVAGGDARYAVALGADAATAALLGPSFTPEDGVAAGAAASDFIESFPIGEGIPFLGAIQGDIGKDSTIQGIMKALASDSGTNIISAPHILTSDNEEAEIRIGDNIPIITSRVQSAQGVVAESALATSVNVERQDTGVTLRVTPQITEGDTLRLDIFQEITAINKGLQADVGNANAVGVPLAKRQIENTVVVADGETVVIGGLISDDYNDIVSKVPWLGDIPFLGWLFKKTERKLTKKNLLVFLTPHIVRTEDDLLKETIRKREEYVQHAQGALELTERERAYEKKKKKEAEKKGEEYEPGRGLNPVRHALLDHEERYPLERMREIEQHQREERERRAAEAVEAQPEYFLQAGLFGDEAQAVEVLTTLVDLGYDATLVSGERNGQLLYEIRVGPYESVQEAEEAKQVIEHSQGLAPSILIQPPEQP